MDLLIPLYIVLIGMVILAIYSLIVALRQTCRQLVRTNERLLVMLSYREGGERAARAMVAASKLSEEKPPKKGSPKGVSEDKQKGPGVMLTYGGGI